MLCENTGSRYNSTLMVHRTSHSVRRGSRDRQGELY